MNFPHYNPYFVFGLTMNAPNFTFNFVGIFAAKWIPLKIRLVVSLMFVFFLTLSMAFIAQYVEEKIGWIIILAVIVITGIASSFLQGGVFGFAGMFPFKYMGGVMIGQGFSGIVMNFFRMICLLIFPPKSSDKDDKSDFYGCLIYFSIASLIVIVCIICFYVVVNTEFARYYLNKASGKDENEDRGRLLASPDSTTSHSSKNNINNTPTGSTYSNIIESSPKKETSFMELYQQIMPIALQVFLCFLITFVVFPGTSLSTKFDFMGTSARDISWFTLIMIASFNVFDTIGRFAGGYYHLFTPKTIFVLSISRLIFIPTFVLIQLKASPSWLFSSDWFRFVNMFLFAFTNGYNSTLCMIFGPMIVKNSLKERAGLIMSFHLVGGIFVGALIASFAMDKVPHP